MLIGEHFSSSAPVGAVAGNNEVLMIPLETFAEQPDRMFVEARFNDQYFSRELVISGNDLYDAESGVKIERFM